MKNLISILIVILFATTYSTAQNANQLVADMVETLGGKKAFYNLGNVSYDFSYHDPNTSLTAIAYEAGFSDQSHFNRVFNAVFNLNPSAYRNKLKT